MSAPPESNSLVFVDGNSMIPQMARKWKPLNRASIILFVTCVAWIGSYLGFRFTGGTASDYNQPHSISDLFKISPKSVKDEGGYNVNTFASPTRATWGNRLFYPLVWLDKRFTVYGVFFYSQHG